ncbi:hypothetical protein E1301_Tti002189 [Triplophysa tibetana]|uniref:Uncharacterized protein n=1 Tax=Triplophysa tibetana TaxID=1572043 RepID=A0A5A9NDG8_9TELE|nr:hypothetical protein E1301_Tti002189 [Triplophysa tibetana]
MMEQGGYWGGKMSLRNGKTLSGAPDQAGPRSYPHSGRNPYRDLDLDGPLLSLPDSLSLAEVSRAHKSSCFCPFTPGPSPFSGSRSNTHTCSPVDTHLSLVWLSHGYPPGHEMAYRTTTTNTGKPQLSGFGPELRRVRDGEEQGGGEGGLWDY